VEKVGDTLISVQRSRLHITGASGSGTTTLARAVASAWSAPHAEVDDYFWLPTDPPYTHKRPEADRVPLMRQVFLPRESWVLSGSLVGWGDDVIAACDAVVLVTLEPVERLRRLEAREQVRRGGEPHDEDAWDAFIAWAAGYDDPTFDGRSRVMHEQWLASLRCPVLRLDSDRPVDELRDQVLAWEPPPPQLDALGRD
jgi:adenylate kinase family enzyme